MENTVGHKIAELERLLAAATVKYTDQESAETLQEVAALISAMKRNQPKLIKQGDVGLSVLDELITNFRKLFDIQ